MKAHAAQLGGFNLFGIFKRQIRVGDRHKIQDEYQKIASSHGWLLDNFDGDPKDPFRREINLIKETNIKDWMPSFRSEDFVANKVEWTMCINIWWVHVAAYEGGLLSSHRFEDDSFSGRSLKDYEESIMNEYVKTLSS